MPQSQCVKIPIRTGRTQEILDWVATLDNRMGDVREALHEEGILSEAAFLERTGDGDYLILYVRAENLEAARDAFVSSENPLNAEFKQVMIDCLDVIAMTTLDLVFEAP